jgi:hypothetical protein
MITVVFVLAVLFAPAEAGNAARGPWKPVLAPTEGFVGQYQNTVRPVSRGRIPAISPWNYRGIGSRFASKNALVLQQKLQLERPLNHQIQLAASQYQQPEPPEEERRLMLGIGLGLGLVYIAFLACWLWATRLRSRPPRH